MMNLPHFLARKQPLALLCFLVTGEAPAELVKLTASNAGAFDRFGQSVAMTEDFLIVGAHEEDTGFSKAGSVYVYDRDTHAFIRKLNASDAGSNDLFGWSLAAEGNQVLVGAPGNDSGACYLFDLNTGAELNKLTPSDAASGDQFGHSVAMTSTTILVGSWLMEDSDISPSEDSGAAYLFHRSNGQELHRLRPADIAEADQFGGSVALTGDYACVGSLFDDHSGVSDAGSVYLFDPSTGAELRKITRGTPAEGDTFGSMLAAKGDLLVTGIPEAGDFGARAGVTSLFSLPSGEHLTDIMPPSLSEGDQFGQSVAIDDFIVVGAFRTDSGSKNDVGSAFVFSTTGHYRNTLHPSDGATSDFFGGAVATQGDEFLIGATQNDDDGPSSGSAYLFEDELDLILNDLTIALSGNNVTLNWTGTAEGEYRIFATSDLSNWPTTPLQTVVPTSSSANFIHTNGADASKLFYRIETGSN
ncbi:FG-GAP repeat protein [Roseibacillus persicicus]|uniref:Uncharacterized protein n=1 Tax=Roseibacillus persicicus TaxID=454148 RepID=A0A918TVC0_9BACT|nr:FG-GAP repeat protein [Roseibacillus persicicus]GHC63427.1 hypothetical protein GCM10007100_33790 [Roseibacillus persicicus]